MIIAADDPALVAQIQLRYGCEEKRGVSVEDINEFSFLRDSWIVNEADLNPRTWIAKALLSRGAVIADSDGTSTITRGRIAQRLGEWVNRICPSYIGDLQPDVVFVGERANPNSATPRMTFRPGADGCGDFLWDSLSDVLDSGITFGLMNSTDENIPSRSAWYVALGETADAFLSSMGVIHARVDHPQYVRRFHYSSKDQYRTNLFEASYHKEPTSWLVR